MNQFKNRLLKGRNKQIVMIQYILLIPILIYLVYSFSFDHINNLYRGMFYILIGTLNLLNSFEDKIFKKKNSNFNIWLIAAIIFFFIGIIELFGF